MLRFIVLARTSINAIKVPVEGKFKADLREPSVEANVSTIKLKAKLKAE